MSPDGQGETGDARRVVLGTRPARSLLRRGLPPGVAVLLLLSSGALNVAGLTGAMKLMLREQDPDAPREHVTVVSLAEPTPSEAVPEEEEQPDPEEALESPPKLETPPPPRPEPEPEPEPVPEEPEPEPEPEPEEEPPEEEPPPEPMPLPDNMKMVEQMDEFDEEDVPDSYDFLSNINRDVLEQTRAEMTNYERDAKEAKAMQLEMVEMPEVGTAAETETADTEERPSQLAKEAIPTPISRDEQRPEENDEQAPLDQVAMKEKAEVAPEEAQEAIEDLAVESESGELQAAREQSSTVLEQEKRSRTTHRDEKYKFKLSANDVAAVFGERIKAMRDVVDEKQSKKEGVWDKAREHYQSPLENVVPEVQPGNQTALRSRKHPFARYIARMHRDIHPSFAEGLLSQLDTHPRSHPLNDMGLWTRVEIVLSARGTVEKVTTVHYSGNTSFDGAARETIWSLGPWPDPPKEILSGNGKVYMHWTFHRDERACGTFGVRPYILDNAGAGDMPDAHAEVIIDPGQASERRLQAPPASGHGHGHAEGPSVPSELRRPPSGGAPPGGTSEARPPSRPSKPGGLTLGSRGGQVGPSQPKPVHPTAPPEPQDKVDPAAKTTATMWIRALRAKDAQRMVAHSGIPFRAGVTVAARNRDELTPVFEAMIDEASGAQPGAPQLYTAAQLRRKYGSVPSGVQEGDGNAYAVVKVGSDTVILIISKGIGRWRVVGVTR